MKTPNAINASSGYSNFSRVAPQAIYKVSNSVSNTGGKLQKLDMLVLKSALLVTLLIASRRPDICQVLDHAFFKQEYILILTYLKNLTLKSDKEKEEFFGGLGDTLMSIPQQVLGQHFAKPLLSRYRWSFVQKF